MKTLECLTKECVELLHKNKLLKPLIKAEIISNALSTVSLNPKLRQQLSQSFMKHFGTSDEEEYKSILARKNINEEEIINSEVASITLKKYCHINFNHQAQARFLERKLDLDIVVYSMIRIKDEFVAREIYHRLIEEEEDFGEIAEKYSEGIENRTRGLVGPVPLGQAHPLIIEALRTSDPGKIQAPKMVEESIVILRLESYEPAQLDKFMREKMEQELFYQWVDDQINNLFANSHPNIGNILNNIGQLEAAEISMRKAVELKNLDLQDKDRISDKDIES